MVRLLLLWTRTHLKLLAANPGSSISLSVPLKSIEVELEVRDHVATVVSTLNYENKEDKPLEAVFVFPLPGDAAVCHFSAQIGQTQIVAEVKEKQKAREEYDDALSSVSPAFPLRLNRCFSFGIGEGASSALINGMAKEGGGHAQFITVTDRNQNSEAAEGCVTLKYSLAGHPSENQLHFSHRPAENSGLGARTLICSLENGDEDDEVEEDGGVEEKVVELSVQSGVSSSFTAFIAVSKDNGERIQGSLLHRDIPAPMYLMGCCTRKDYNGEYKLCCCTETNEEVEKSKPEKASSEVWASILALIWLHGFKMDAKDEWELLAAKAVSWLRAQNAPSVTDCVEAGNIHTQKQIYSILHPH
ncbi:unnamed protein product [Oreochromis niloticus]|nr:unnamed protein product [Mustela putorius furo]